MSSSDEILPPLPKGEPWDPKLPDDELFAKPGERRRTDEDLNLITSILESAGVTCCFVGVMALRHFGAKRISLDVDICVPSTKLDDARRAILKHPDVYASMKPRNQYDPTGRRHEFPWFRQIGVRAFYVLIPDTALRFSCIPSNIELSSGEIPIPCPIAGAWAEALIDLSWQVDLDDMVDGLVATEEWANENVREPYRKRLNDSIAGMKRRMLGKYSEDQYVSRFRRKPRPTIQQPANE